MTPIGLMVTIGAGAIVGLLLIYGLLDALGGRDGPQPTYDLISCEIEDVGLLPSATVQFTITNPSRRDDSYRVEFVVYDAGGAKVGDGSEYVSDVPAGGTSRAESTFFLDAKGGRTCQISDIH